MFIDFKACPEDTCFVDLRTAKEYAEGSIGKAVHLPIFTDNERHIIGTLYKQESTQLAKKTAVDAVSTKLPDLYEQVVALLAQYTHVVLFCARGGMRSQTLGSLLNAMGHPVYVLQGGYKGYRNAMLEETERLNARLQYIVLHGLTGTGKTEILHHLDAEGCPVLDLEALANHRGSMLGQIGIGVQMCQKSFEHQVYARLRAIEKSFPDTPYVFVEAESRRIGTLLVPQCIMDRMRVRGYHLDIEADLEFRSRQITKDYICYPGAVEEISDTLIHFTKALGKARVAELQALLAQGNIQEVARCLMVEYYDPKYQFRQYPVLERFWVTDTRETARALQAWCAALKALPKATQIFAMERIEGDAHDTVYTQLGEMLRQGQLVVFPTETVYGLGADALDPEGVRKIYEAKGRPSDNPLIVHIHRQSQLQALVTEVSPLSQCLMDAFWPGPLTLIFQKSASVPEGITGGLDTVAVRMPNHPAAAALLAAAGVPVAAPSANLSGKPSPTRASHVLTDLFGRVDGILCEDSCRIGVESTVVDARGEEVYILRPGGVTREQLEQVVAAYRGSRCENRPDSISYKQAFEAGKTQPSPDAVTDRTSTREATSQMAAVAIQPPGGKSVPGGESASGVITEAVAIQSLGGIVDAADGESENASVGITEAVAIQSLGGVMDAVGGDLAGSVPLAPGMKYIHYAPRAPLYLAARPGIPVSPDEEAYALLEQGKHVGILTTDGGRAYYEGLHPNFYICSLGATGDLHAHAERVFDALREFDRADVALIYSEAFPEMGIGVALMNRLKKAAKAILPDNLPTR